MRPWWEGSLDFIQLKFQVLRPVEEPGFIHHPGAPVYPQILVDPVTEAQSRSTEGFVPAFCLDLPVALWTDRLGMWTLEQEGQL